LLPFDGNLYARNEHGLFVLKDPLNKDWKKVQTPTSGSVVITAVGPYMWLRSYSVDKLWCMLPPSEGPQALRTPWLEVIAKNAKTHLRPIYKMPVVMPQVSFHDRIYGNTGGTSCSVWRTDQIIDPETLQKMCGKFTLAKVAKKLDMSQNELKNILSKKNKVIIVWDEVVPQGFGDPKQNTSIDFLGVFNNKIYAGVGTLGKGSFGDPANYGPGVRIFESSSGDVGSWMQINADGFGTEIAGRNFKMHQRVGSWAVYMASNEQLDRLYVGTLSHFGAEVWKYDGSGKAGWQNVTPPWAGPGPFNGPGRNKAMVVFGPNLYLAEGFPTGNLAKYDGTNWTVVISGPYPFDPNNQGFHSGAVLGEKLYVSTIHKPYSGVTQGDQVWGYPFP
jgi:hypothetical protein